MQALPPTYGFADIFMFEEVILQQAKSSPISGGEMILMTCYACYGTADELHIFVQFRVLQPLPHIDTPFPPIDTPLSPI